MQLTVDTDLTSHYADGYALALIISPTANSAHLAWTPSGYAEDQTFDIRLGRDPLPSEAVAELRRTIEEFPRLAVIGDAAWEYGDSRWAEGPWWEAIADLEGQLWGVIDAWR